MKYKLLTAAEFLDVFVKRLKESKLPEWEETVPWTKMVLKGILPALAKEFGFEPQDEYLNIDQVWVMYVESQIAALAVAIEHEASEEEWENIVWDEGSKLVDVKSHLKVLICYPALSEFEDFAKGFASGISLQELRLDAERYLAIGICADREHKQLVVKGAEISPEGRITFLNDARLPYTQF